MRVMTTKQATEYLNAPPPNGLGMSVSHAWVRKQSEPDADGKRALPFFKMNDGRTSRLMITDEALMTHFRRLQDEVIAL